MPSSQLISGFNHGADSANPQCSRLAKFGTIGQCTAELFMIKQIFKHVYQEPQ